MPDLGAGIKTMVEYDVMILGGGCAGLSLASRLAELGSNCPRVLIPEKRPVYSNDRTWCFWDDGNLRTRLLSRHQWHSMSIQTRSQKVKVDCESSP